MSSVPLSGRDLLYDIEQFYYQEVNLLSNGRYEEWLRLLADDIRYWMPARMTRARREDAVSTAAELAVYDDDKHFLSARVERLGHALAHAEQPPSRIRYFITNVCILSAPEADVDVRCNFLIHQTRLERLEVQYVGERFDRLRRDGQGWLVAARKIVLDQTMIPRSISIFF